EAHLAVRARAAVQRLALGRPLRIRGPFPGLLGRALGVRDAGLGALVHLVDAGLVALDPLLRLLRFAREVVHLLVDLADLAADVLLAGTAGQDQPGSHHGNDDRSHQASTVDGTAPLTGTAAVRSAGRSHCGS